MLMRVVTLITFCYYTKLPVIERGNLRFFIAQEKSMPDFKDPRTGWVFIVRGIVEDFELKPVFVILSILGLLRIKLNLLYQCSLNRETKLNLQSIYLPHGVWNIINSPLGLLLRRKGFLLKH